jgi:hypothetical protein
VEDLLSAERVDGAMEQLGTGVYDHGRAGELVFFEMPFCRLLVKR